MSIETLESLLKNPDIWDIELSTQNMRDVLLEMASRVDNLISFQDKYKQNNFEKSTEDDFHDVMNRVDSLARQCDRQNTDFGAEIKELKALFNFQLRDMREKLERNLNSIITDASRPPSPPTPLLTEIPENENKAEIDQRLQSMGKDITHLKDRVRGIMTALNNPAPQSEIKPIEIINSRHDVLKPDEKQIELIEDEKKTKIDDISDIDKERLSEQKRVSYSQPQSPVETSRSILQTSRSKKNDRRFDEIKEKIEDIIKNRKSDTEKINSTIKAVNSLITEKDNQSKQIQQCMRETKSFNDEFDRLYQKMAELQVEMDKVKESTTNPTASGAAELSQNQIADILAAASTKSADGQRNEIPNFNAVFQKMKDSFTDNLSQIDANYRQQIHFLKLEIAQLKQVLADKMLIPANMSPPKVETPKTTEEEPSIDEEDKTLDDQLEANVKTPNKSKQVSQHPSNRNIDSPKTDIKAKSSEKSPSKLNSSRAEAKKDSQNQHQNQKDNQSTTERVDKEHQTEKPETKEIEVQTLESLLDGIPTRHINVELQQIRIANEIATQEILIRDPISFTSSQASARSSGQGAQSTFTEPPKPRVIKRPSRKSNKLITTETQATGSDDNNASISNIPKFNQPDANPPLADAGSSTTTQPNHDSQQNNSSTDENGPNLDASTSSHDLSNQKRGPSISATVIETKMRKKRKVKKDYVDVMTEAIDDDAPLNRSAPRTPQQRSPLNASPPDSPLKNPPKYADSETETDKTKHSATKEENSDANNNENEENNENNEDNENDENDANDENSRKTTETGTETSTETASNENAKNSDTSVGTEVKAPTERTNRTSAPVYVTIETETELVDEEDLKDASTHEHEMADSMTGTNEPVPNKSSLKSAPSKLKKSRISKSTNLVDSCTSTDHVMAALSSSPNAANDASKPGSIKEEPSPANEDEEYDDEEEPVIYASCGISTDKHKEEENEYEEDNEPTRVYTVIDDGIQTDGLENGIPGDGVLPPGMEFMEQYNTRPTQPSITANMSGFGTYLPPKVFNLNHLLSLTIVSDYKPPEQQQIVVKIPEGENGPNIDIPAILNQVLAQREDHDINAINENLNEHTKQIAEIFDTLQILQSPTLLNPNDPNSSTNGNSSSDNNGRPFGYSTTYSNNGGNSQPRKVFVPGGGIKPQTRTQNMVIFDVNSKGGVSNPRPGQVNFVGGNKTQNGYNNSNNSNNDDSNDIELLKERLDQFELSVSSLESQFYNLEKNLINQGAMRPNSAIIDDDKPYSSHLFKRIVQRNSQNASPTRTNRAQEDDFRINTNRSDRGHRSQQQQISNNRSNPKIPNPNRPVGLIEDPNDADKPLFDDDHSKINDVHLLDVNPSDNLNLEDKPVIHRRVYDPYDPNHNKKLTSVTDNKQIDIVGEFTIDPDFEMGQKVQPEVIKPEDITIPKYERQFRLLREAVVELRTNIQILKVKSEQPVILPNAIQDDQQEEVKSERSFDENTLKNLRRKIDLKLEDFNERIDELRRELYEHLAKPPDKIIEVRTEVVKVEKKPEKDDKADEPPPPPVSKIDVDLNLIHAIENLTNLERDRVISIHRLATPPDVREHREKTLRDSLTKKPFVEKPLATNPKPSKNETNSKPPPSSPKQSNSSQQQQQTLTDGKPIDQPVEFGEVPPPTSTPVYSKEKNKGHEVPQIVHDMKVLNAMPKKDMLELLMPFLYELRSELMITIDSNTERIRCMEKSIKNKVEKDFIDAFFRKIRAAVQETDEKAMRATALLTDKITRQDLEDRIQELVKQIGSQESTVAGKSSFTCLFCGSKKSSVAKGGGGILAKGKVYKGSTTRCSLPANEVSQLPPLDDNG